MRDLAVIIVSTSEAHWVEQCLPTVFARAGDLSLDVIVVDNDSRDETRRIVEDRFPEARVVSSANHGFGHANNRALMECDARYVLFLNPDTQVLEGTLADMVARMDAAPQVGLMGYIQVDPAGHLHPTMRRFPNALRTLMEALGSEHLPGPLTALGQRELRLERYREEFDLDWTSGSFMLTRREALESAGWFDERFFMYSDEVDLAFRIKQAGWLVRHTPHMTILHHAGKMGFKPQGHAQMSYSQRLYARKHFSPVHRVAYLATFAVNFVVRYFAYGAVKRGDPDAARAMRRALSALAGGDPPYQPAPETAVRPRSAETTQASSSVR